MRERRKFIRIPESAPITYEIMDDPETGEHLTKDISQGGIRFFVHRFVPVNSFLRIKLFLKKITFYFEALVKVVWIRRDPHGERFEVGVEFINMPRESTEHLIEYIQSVLNLMSASQ